MIDSSDLFIKKSSFQITKRDKKDVVLFLKIYSFIISNDIIMGKIALLYLGQGDYGVVSLKLRYVHSIK